MPDVSVVVPVFNVIDYLKECLDSVLGQRLKGFTLEVIAVDDGSVDGSGALLDQIASTDSRLRVVHQSNSGWPGQPRNRGIELATGRYLFFCDADDVLPDESLQRLVAFADKHGSDVVIPKIVGGNGRWVRRWLYDETQVDADLFKAFHTHGPQKLFRRCMVMDYNIRFPEHEMRIEDAMFGFRCYTVAKRVSILADYDYYVLQNREDGSNISRKSLDPSAYTRDCIQVASIVQDGLPAGELRDRIITELYRRLCLNRYIGQSFSKASTEYQEIWIRGHQEFAAAFVPPALDEYLKPVDRQRSKLIRSGRRDDLVVMAASTPKDALAVKLEGVSSTEAGCHVTGSLRVQNQFRRLTWAVLELRRRGHDEQITFNIYPDSRMRPAGGSDELPEHVDFDVTIDHEVLKHYPRGTYDVFLRTAADGVTLSSRMTALSGDVAVHYPGTDAIDFYATKHGNVSCRI